MILFCNFALLCGTIRARIVYKAISLCIHANRSVLRELLRSIRSSRRYTLLTSTDRFSLGMSGFDDFWDYNLTHTTFIKLKHKILEIVLKAMWLLCESQVNHKKRFEQWNPIHRKVGMNRMFNLLFGTDSKVLRLLLAHCQTRLQSAFEKLTQTLPWQLLIMVPVAAHSSACVQHRVKVRIQFITESQRFHECWKSASKNSRWRAF